jgi:hypothetical protein
MQQGRAQIEMATDKSPALDDGIPEERCSDCRRFGDFLPSWFSLRHENYAAKDKIPDFEYTGITFFDLDKSAAAGCDLCRLLWGALIMDGSSYRDLLLSNSLIRISLKTNLQIITSERLCLKVICGRQIATSCVVWDCQTKGIVKPKTAFDLPSSNVTGDLDLAKAWFMDCCYEHKECEERTTDRLPRRLIRISDDGSEMRLLVTSSSTCDSKRSDLRASHKEPYAYCALSYCWGEESNSLQLSRDNIDTFSKAIPWTELPKTIRDAATITKALGLCYLW